MPPPPRVLEEFYKTKTVAEIEESKGHKRSGFARVQLDGGSRWTQQWVVLDVGGDCAVVCLARGEGAVKPVEVLSSSHYSAESLDTEEAQGPSDYCFQLTDFGSSPPRHYLFSVDSAADRDGWLDAFDDHGDADAETGTGFSVTDMTGKQRRATLRSSLQLRLLRSFSSLVARTGICLPARHLLHTVNSFTFVLLPMDKRSSLLRCWTSSRRN